MAVVLAALFGASAEAVSFSISPGGPPVTVTISTSGQTATASFAGTANQRVSLYISGSTISQMKISLVKPNGNNLFTVSATKAAKFVDQNTLPTTGTYKLVVDPNSTYTGKVTLTLYNIPPDASNTVTVGGAGASVSTTVPGQDAYFTFSGVATHRLALSLTGVTISGGSLTLLDPNGAVVTGPKAFSTAPSFVDPITLSLSGTYKAVIDPKGKATGSATLTAYDVPPDTSAPLTLGNQATGTTTVPGQRNNFTFARTANQRVSLVVESSDFTGTIWLLKPDSSVLTSIPVGPAGGFLDATVLPTNGTYTFVVDPSGDSTGALSFTAYDVPADPTQAITAGGPAVTVTNTVPGQNGKLTFTGALNQKISVLVSNVVGVDPAELDLLKPNGQSVLTAPITVTGTGAWLQPIVLPVAGQYTIVLDPQQANVGSADVNLYTVPADLSGTITPGTPLAISTTAPGQNAKYTFTGTTGQRISLDLTAVTIQNVKVTIQKPDGTTLVTKSVGTSGGFIEPTTLPVGGTYKVVVDPQSSYFGGITLGLYVVPTDQTGTMAAGTAKVLTTTVPGQNAKWTFSGTSGQRLSFNFTSFSWSGTSPSVKVTVRTPSNAILLTTTLSSDDFFPQDGNPVYTLTATGTYSVTIDPQGASTGSLTVTYYVVPADSTGSTSCSVTVPGQNCKLTITSTTGSHTFTIATTVPPPSGQTQSVSVTVYQGSTIDFAHWIAEGTGGPDGNSFPASLPANGTYTLVVDPFGAATGSVTVTVS
jgi:hypothetical protein